MAGMASGGYSATLSFRYPPEDGFTAYDARSLADGSVQPLPAGEARVHVVPVGHVVLPESPAQEHQPPRPFGREVHQAGLDVPQDDALGGEPLHAVPQGADGLRVLLALGSAA